jgi:hypothetical protein
MLTAWEHPDRIQPVRVLRVTLRGPVTLGHVLLLDEIGSPVVTGEQFELGDLAIATLVCFEPTAEAAKKSLRSWWSKRIIRIWGGICGRLDIQSESDRFAEWFSAQCGGPEQKTKIRDGHEAPEPLSAPWYINKLASAVGELGLSIEEASALPMKRLNQITGALAESRGNASFLREDEVEFFENVKRWEAEKARN